MAQMAASSTESAPRVQTWAVKELLVLVLEAHP